MYDAKLNGWFGEYQQNNLEAFLAANATNNVAPWTEDNQVLLKQYLAGTTTLSQTLLKPQQKAFAQQAITDIQGILFKSYRLVASRSRNLPNHQSY